MQVLSSGLLSGATYSLGAMGMGILFGILRMVNISHGAWMILGSLLACQAFLHWQFPLIAVLAVFIFFLAVGGWVFRWVVPARLYCESPTRAAQDSLLTTLSLSLILEEGMIFLWPGPEPGLSLDLPNLEFAGVILPLSRLAVFPIVTTFWLILLFWLKWTREGRALRAMVQDRQAASLMGISEARMIHGSLMLAALLAGVAGLLYAFLYAPSISMAMELTVKAFGIVALGGLGHFRGILASGRLPRMK